jgi:coproporphyrinogen III oxidase-like Fe-S oxidoreductase
MKNALQKFQHSFFSSILSEVIDKITYQQLEISNIPETFQYPQPDLKKKYVLYTHIPFCESLCPYCSFNRFIFNEKKTRDYFKNLRRELDLIADLGYDFVNMYVGGGTPTVIVDELIETIDYAKKLFNIQEVSCETNPNHLTKEILTALKGRVDRLSVGVQSFDDTLLKQMSRYDKFGSGEKILEIIQNAVGILPALNVDMIYNLPDQTETMLLKDLEFIKRSGAEQTTFYPLMSAPSVKRAMERTLGRVNQNREYQFFQLIADGLHGEYNPSSAWTFSRKDVSMIDEYIVKYEEYVGAGSGSFSYLNGNLLVNTFSLKQYEQKIQKGKLPVYAVKSFAKRDRMRYRMMMELFDLSLDKKKFINDFGGPVEWELLPELLFLRLAGAFKPNGKDYLLLEPNARYLMVVMMREFFANVNILRDQARFALPQEERLMCIVNDKLYHNEFA